MRKVQHKRTDALAHSRYDREAASGQSKSSTLSQRISNSRSQGRPIDAEYRRVLETRLGHDFSDVRVHDDSEADSLSRDVDARAFTFGQDIFFRDGEFQPDSIGGFRLLAHETTHTAQQRPIDSAQPEISSNSEEDPRLEREAHEVGTSAASRIASASQTVSHVAAAGIQRWPWDDEKPSDAAPPSAGGWTDGFKNVMGIQEKKDDSAWSTYNQWNNALTGRTTEARLIGAGENYLDNAGAKAQADTNQWIDKNTDEGSWLRTLGHGATRYNRWATDNVSGALSAGLSMATGMLDAAAHPLDTGVNVLSGIYDDTKIIGDFGSNLGRMATGKGSWAKTEDDFMTDAKQTTPMKLLTPFINDIEGNPQKMINGKPDEGGHWAKAFGRVLGTAAVGGLAEEVQRSPSGTKGGTTPEPTIPKPETNIPNPSTAEAAAPAENIRTSTTEVTPSSGEVTPPSGEVTPPSSDVPPPAPSSEIPSTKVASTEAAPIAAEGQEPLEGPPTPYGTPTHLGLGEHRLGFDEPVTLREPTVETPPTWRDRSGAPPTQRSTPTQRGLGAPGPELPSDPEINPLARSAQNPLMPDITPAENISTSTPDVSPLTQRSPGVGGPELPKVSALAESTRNPIGAPPKMEGNLPFAATEGATGMETSPAAPEAAAPAVDISPPPQESPGMPSSEIPSSYEWAGAAWEAPPATVKLPRAPHKWDVPGLEFPYDKPDIYKVDWAVDPRNPFGPQDPVGPPTPQLPPAQPDPPSYREPTMPNPDPRARRFGPGVTAADLGLPTTPSGDVDVEALKRLRSE
jgi:hypothetical protein